MDFFNKKILTGHQKKHLAFKKGYFVLKKNKGGLSTPVASLDTIYIGIFLMIYF